MPVPPGLPNDASLKVHAVTDPERLYDLATDPARASEGNGAILKLATVLTEHHSQAATDWAVRLAEHLARAEGPEGGRGPMRRIAWQLVQRPSTVALGPHFAHPPTDLDDPATEFRACLLQEMALRWGLDDEPYVSYGARLRDLGHPLAWLPLTSLYFENAMRSAAVMQGGILGSMSPAELRARFAEIPPTESGARAGRTARQSPDALRADAAMGPFAELAQSEAVFYTLPQPLDPADFNSALLAELDAPCLHNLTRDTLTAVHTTADDIAGDLLVAAFSGGLWGEGHEGAYSRLLTWRSLYALMDLDPDVSHHDAVRRAYEHRWLRFAAARRTSNWFHGDLTDCAFAVLDPSRTRIAVLAATETD
ncbi:DUF6183 family protein [Streptomyces sp. NPDC054841]